MPGIVGGFPNLREINRRTIRGPINETDKTTIVSVYPKKIRFKNITLMPRTWEIEAGSQEKPALLHVGSGSWWKDTHPDEPLIEIPVGSISVAQSLVTDWMNGIHGYDVGVAQPGLYCIPGLHDLKAVTGEFSGLLAQAVERQNNYYMSLLKYADSIWARSNGNPLTISDEMRLAARVMGKLDKDWMKDFVNTGQVRCNFCGSFKSPEYPICQSCHTADPSHPRFKAVMEAKRMQAEMLGENPFSGLNGKEAIG